MKITWYCLLAISLLGNYILSWMENTLKIVPSNKKPKKGKNKPWLSWVGIKKECLFSHLCLGSFTPLYHAIEKLSPIPQQSKMTFVFQWQLDEKSGKPPPQPEEMTSDIWSTERSIPICHPNFLRICQSQSWGKVTLPYSCLWHQFSLTVACHENHWAENQPAPPSDAFPGSWWCPVSSSARQNHWHHLH